MVRAQTARASDAWSIVAGVALVMGLSMIAVSLTLASVTTAWALELNDEPLSIAKEGMATTDEPAGESVGEPAPGDAPVEGEPGPGETVAVPPDEQGDAGSPDGTTGDDKPKE